MPQNRAWVLASCPTGWVQEDNFKLVESTAPQPKDGEVLVKNLWLSLDPYMRGRLSQQKSYAKSVEIGEVMTGETAAEVIESRHPKFRAGDTVTAFSGWQLYGCHKGELLTKADATRVPLSCFLGCLGMPGPLHGMAPLEQIAGKGESIATPQCFGQMPAAKRAQT